jgi:hypothetical protein
VSQLSASGRYVTDATHRFLLLLKSMSSKLGLAIGLGLARGCRIAGQYERHVGKNKGQRSKVKGCHFVRSFRLVPIVLHISTDHRPSTNHVEYLTLSFLSAQRSPSCTLCSDCVEI